MLSEHDSIRLARLSIHGMMPAGEKALNRESVLMVISCDGEDDSAG
jgi:hypothetical protein